MTEKTTPRMRTAYLETVKPALQEKFQYGSAMQVPQPVKVVINMGLGQAIQNPKALEVALADLETITGQKAVPTKARKSISNFKLREGMSIGARVTLRDRRMWEFLDRFINVALPRIRDFRGVPTRLSGHGDYTLGLKDQLIFPEIEYDKVDEARGMNVTIVTTAKTDEEGRALLKALDGVPEAERGARFRVLAARDEDVCDLELFLGASVATLALGEIGQRLVELRRIEVGPQGVGDDQRRRAQFGEPPHLIHRGAALVGDRHLDGVRGGGVADHGVLAGDLVHESRCAKALRQRSACWRESR